MPRVVNTHGDRGIDEEFDRILRRLDALEAKPPGTTVQQTIQQAAPPAGVSSLAAGSTQAFGDLTLTGTHGVLITQSGQDFSFEVNVEVLGADPSSPADGRMWVRSDLLELRIRVAGTTRTAALT